MKTKRLLGAILATLLTTIACSQIEQMSQNISEIQAAQLALAEAYPNEDIEVQIDSMMTSDGSFDTVTVIFVNSAFYKLAQAKQLEQAQEIAQSFADNYESSDTLDVIAVIFRQHSETLGFSSDLDMSYEFDPLELK